MLVKEARGGADADIAEISRAEAEQIAAVLAARNWPPDAAGLPGRRAPICNDIPARALETPAGEGEVFGGRVLLGAASGWAVCDVDQAGAIGWPTARAKVRRGEGV
jgi:hypothetical protein